MMAPQEQSNEISNPPPSNPVNTREEQQA